MQRYLLLGTAGHIDHGKTSLIRALTGEDTDRLPEEKRRGITVDLGFAALQIDDLQLGIIDVPGHERFVKNMLAGAMGIDLVLLVVAADEGVMPQTREHFEALSYLNLKTGVIAVTKCDLVDDDIAELVEEEISELVSGSFLENAKIIRVSTKTGRGLDELRKLLAAAAKQVHSPSSEGPFKISIDRCFSAPGLGTVVTGSVASGYCKVGDSLQLLPQAAVVTVRNLESYGKQLDSIEKGQRAAINLSGIHFSEVHRGDVLVTVGSLVPSSLLSVRVEASRLSKLPLKNLTGVRFYSGATETPGRLRLLETQKLAAGKAEVAQIELQQPVCTNWGEPFVIRGLAANEVLGGGRVLDACAYRLSHRDTTKIKSLRELGSAEEKTRIAALISLIGATNWTIEALWQRTGVSDAASVIDQLVELGEFCRFDLKGNTRWLHRDTVAKLNERFLAMLSTEHQQDLLSPMVPLGRLKQHFDALEPAELLTSLAARLEREELIRLDGEYVALAEWRPQLSANQTTLLEDLVSICQQAGLSGPTIGELAEKFQKTPDEVESLLKVAASAGDLTRMPDKESRDAQAAQRARLYLHSAAVEALVGRVCSEFSEREPWTISQFGEHVGLSRKYAIPLCGYLDQTGVTVRQGDIRSLAPASSRSS